MPDMALPTVELEQLLSEPAAEAEQRALTKFDRETEPHGTQLVLFGAGNMGRRVLSRLRLDGIEPLAFADNQTRLWGEQVDGLVVLSPEDAASRFGRAATFIVTIYNSPGRSFPHVQEQLVALGCDNVIPVVSVRWKYHETFLPYYHDDLPHRLLLEKDAVRNAFALWSDDQSRHEYVAQIAWRLHGDSGRLGLPLTSQQYFPDVFRLTDDEFFVDVGAYDGDTVRQFLALRGDAFRRVLALEPEPDNAQRLATFLSGLPAKLQDKIEMRPLAAGRQACRIHFAAGDGVQSAVSARGNIEVDCVRLDDLLSASRPTYIKMDIEGAEPDAIQGCGRILREDRPVLAACVYHAHEHLWSIPRLINQLAPEHSLFLRPHMPECWDTVCYAVPPHRMIRHAE